MMRKEKIFWGVFFVLAAAFMIISQLGFLQGVGAFRIIWAVFCVAVIINGVIKQHFGEILFPLAFICILFDKQLGITALTPWTVLGAALLGTIGLSMLFHKRRHHRMPGYVHMHMDGEEGFERVENGADGNHVHFKTSFGSAIKYVNSDDFEYAELECSFGAMKVYFDNAMLQNQNATIELEVSFGGVELYMPKSWNVINHTDTTFGGIDEKNRNQPDGSHTVTLTGDVSFAGVTIIYV